MIRIHGMSRSNYTNLIKACFLEKGIEHEEVKVFPNQEDDYLAKSPMGKVPCIETQAGFISETFAIADYLDHINPDNPLLPTDAFTRAKAIELIRHLELDVELVARRCLMEAVFGKSVSEEVKAATEKDLAKGMQAFGRLVVCGPYAAGAEFGLADLYVYFTFGLASVITEKMFGRDILADLPNVKSLIARLAERDSIRTIETANAA